MEENTMLQPKEGEEKLSQSPQTPERAAVAAEVYTLFLETGL